MFKIIDLINNLGLNQLNFKLKINKFNWFFKLFREYFSYW